MYVITRVTASFQACLHVPEWQYLHLVWGFIRQQLSCTFTDTHLFCGMQEGSHTLSWNQQADRQGEVLLLGLGQVLEVSPHPSASCVLVDRLVLPVWVCFLSDGSLQFLVPQGELFTLLQTLVALWAEKFVTILLLLTSVVLRSMVGQQITSKKYQWVMSWDDEGCFCYWHAWCCHICSSCCKAVFCISSQVSQCIWITTILCMHATVGWEYWHRAWLLFDVLETCYSYHAAAVDAAAVVDAAVVNAADSSIK